MITPYPDPGRFVRACVRKEEGAKGLGEVKEKGDGGRGDVSCARAHGRKKAEGVGDKKEKGGMVEGRRTERGRVGGEGALRCPPQLFSR